MVYFSLLDGFLNAFYGSVTLVSYFQGLLASSRFKMNLICCFLLFSHPGVSRRALVIILRGRGNSDVWQGEEKLHPDPGPHLRPTLPFAGGEPCLSHTFRAFRRRPWPSLWDA